MPMHPLSPVAVDMKTATPATTAIHQFPSTSPLGAQVLPLIPMFSLSSSTARTCPFRGPLPSYTVPTTSLRTQLLVAARSLRHIRTDDVRTGVAEFDQLLAIKKKAAELSSNLKGTSIFLVGINNPMKKNLGKLLADELRYYYFDSDNLVEEAAGGQSAARQLRENDEEGFRESETEVLKQLSSMGRLVVCAGDGAVKSSTNLALLRHGISIWIDVPIDIVMPGVVDLKNSFHASDPSTSGSHSEVMDQLIQRYEDARGGYTTADATVSLQKVGCQLGYDHLDAVTAEDMALEVLSEIEKLARVKRMIEDAARPF